MTLHSIEDILSDLRAGRMVVIMDDEDRENEGDLLMAAEHVRPEDVNFMARYGRGLICLTLTQERCKQLRLPLMVSDTHLEHATNFTVSIEAAEGVTTGISAHDRAHTIQTAVDPKAVPGDLRQPGHIFPLMAQPGGVLTRAGHTEAGCDLTRLAGCQAAAVIVEILNDDGTMARRPDLEKFAEHHGLKIGTIADLIRYRLEKERSVERIAERQIATEFGPFRMVAYEDHVNQTVHLALVRGDISKVAAPLVRVHLRDTVRDLVGVQLAAEGCGVVVLLRPAESPRDLMDAVGGLASAETAGGARSTGMKVLRTYGIGAQILKDLGVNRMRVLSAPRQMLGLSGFDLEVVEYVES